MINQEIMLETNFINYCNVIGQFVIEHKYLADCFKPFFYHHLKLYHQKKLLVNDYFCFDELLRCFRDNNIFY